MLNGLCRMLNPYSYRTYVLWPVVVCAHQLNFKHRTVRSCTIWYQNRPVKRAALYCTVLVRTEWRLRKTQNNDTVRINIDMRIIRSSFILSYLKRHQHPSIVAIMSSKSLATYARAAVLKYPNSDVEVAIGFCEELLPGFMAQSNDRLLKMGRSITSLVCDSDAEILEAGLRLLLEECQLLLSGKVQVPKVRFGKTGLPMPIVTLGCMRFQQEWGPRITNMNQVGSDCQDNLVAILKTAFAYGMTHIETARGYGCSELQLGVALKQLYATTDLKREDLIIQTKIPPNRDPVAFREAIELSLKSLQVDYVDLFAFHGMNFEEQFDWVFGQGNNCLSVVKEYIAAGKIRHLGFSTHGSTSFILKCINTDVFAYVNLHYHYFGSYTASGGGHDGNGNLDCIKLLEEKDIGRFVISPFDKGGRLYASSKKLRSLTLPEMEPMSFGSFWLWNHHLIYDEGLPQLHTYTVGAARPSDLDEPAVAAFLHATKPEEVSAKVKIVTKRLDEAKEQALGKEWVQSWWKGLPKSTGSKYLVEHNQIIWIYNCIKAFGMYEFGKARYNSFEKNEEKWDSALSDEQNIAEKIGKNPWGFVPGRPLRIGTDYSEDLANVPDENKQLVKDAEDFVYKWCRDKKLDQKIEDREGVRGPLTKTRSFIKRNFSVSAQIFKLPDQELEKATNGDDIPLPEGWGLSYDMRTWPDYPDQPSRA